MQGLLEIHHDLAPVFKGQRDHAPHPLVIDVCIGLIVQAVAGGFNAFEQVFCAVHEFEVGHYNLPMLKVRQILVITIVLAAGTVVLSSCGQKGPLILPPPQRPRHRNQLRQRPRPSFRPPPIVDPMNPSLLPGQPHFAYRGDQLFAEDVCLADLAGLLLAFPALSLMHRFRRNWLNSKQ